VNIRSNAFSFPLQNLTFHLFPHDVGYMQNSLWTRDIPPSLSDVFNTTAILIRHGAGTKGSAELMIVMIDYFGRAAWTIRGIWTWKLLISLLFTVLTSLFIISTTSTSNHGAWGSVVVETLRYLSDGPGIDSRWCHWIFQWHIPSGRIMALGSTQSNIKISSRNISWG
jgi:hypothetical protein